MKFLSIVRCILEIIFGGFLLLGTFAQIPLLIASFGSDGYSIARTLGRAAGMLIIGTLGFYVFRDGLRVGNRMRSNPVA